MTATTAQDDPNQPRSTLSVVTSGRTCMLHIEYDVLFVQAAPEKCCLH